MTTTTRPEFVTIAQTPTAVVRGVVPTAELPAFFDRSFGLLGEVLAAQSVQPIGPAFALYQGLPGETADLEVGFPVGDPVRPDRAVVAGSLPAGRVARLVHHGAFDDLGASWERLASWIAGQGVHPGPVFWEVYLTEPTPDMDPRELRTELNWPVSG